MKESKNQIVSNISLFHDFQLSVCKDLQLPPSEFAYSADLISISSPNPLDSAPIQVGFVCLFCPVDIVTAEQVLYATMFN